MISIDGGKLHLLLAHGSVELHFESREELSKALWVQRGQSEDKPHSKAEPHSLYDEGIFGL